MVGGVVGSVASSGILVPVAIGAYMATDAAGKENECRVHLYQTMQLFLGEDFGLVGQSNLLQIRLFVFARKSSGIFGIIKDVETNTLATGILNMIGNKGAAIVSFKVNDRSLCFCCCHLAAHEGQDFLDARNRSAKAILSSTTDKEDMLDIPAMYDHVFFLGDLNYRLDPYLLNASVGSHRGLSGFDLVCSYIEKREWGKLSAADTLAIERENGRALCGFEEGTLQWPPTFKYNRVKDADEDGFTDSNPFNTKRLPSYTDRVLYHSLPCLKNRLILKYYRSCQSTKSSDHKPVLSLFALKLGTPKAHLRCLTVRLSSLSVTFPCNQDAETGLYNPYVVSVEYCKGDLGSFQKVLPEPDIIELSKDDATVTISFCELNIGFADAVKKYKRSGYTGHILMQVRRKSNCGLFGYAVLSIFDHLVEDDVVANCPLRLGGTRVGSSTITLHLFEEENHPR
mmetsp:Transcript_4739/g.29931  ORF Transcript_4739/g.29931 Transcript_4739/m.29931 type:complete len:455 (-) Transcript_4739:3588-4952(-)